MTAAEIAWWELRREVYGRLTQPPAREIFIAFSKALADKRDRDLLKVITGEV